MTSAETFQHQHTPYVQRKISIACENVGKMNVYLQKTKAVAIKQMKPVYTPLEDECQTGQAKIYGFHLTLEGPEQHMSHLKTLLAGSNLFS
ncbi:MAG: hypothetical protein AAGI66_05045 [Cyanobacteria bacterium P01_H01_bin.74]